MRQNPSFALADTNEIKRLIRENPWATLVSNATMGLVASHYPVMVDETREELSIVSHLGRPDELIHELGEHEMLVIIQGPHGYISPGWYDENGAVPTWNFVVAHLSGEPEILTDEENWDVLGRLVDHFEERMPHPRPMAGTEADEAYARRIFPGTVGFRLTPTRIVAKNKMSQNKPGQIVENVLNGLSNPGPFESETLADEMRRAHAKLRR